MINIEEQNNIRTIFPEKGIIVDKRLAHFNEQFRKIPTFIIDYLIAEMVDSDNPEPGLVKIEKLLNDHFMESYQKEWIKSQIRECGEYVLLGRIRCRFDENKDEYWVDVTSLGNNNVRINPYLIAEYGDILLTTGAWGVFKIIYNESYEYRNKIYPFEISEFKPIQITDIDTQIWIERRGKFTDDGWLNLMINSIGFDPNFLSKEEKILYMVRLIPFIESNINIIEMGPTMTGKTFTYQSISSHAFVISGGQTTVASLFYDKLRRQIGLVGYRDVVMFDEFVNTSGSNKLTGQTALVDILKDFMNSGRFSRGTAEFASDCSIVFAGNIDCDVENKAVSGRYRSLFDPLPRCVGRDRAFLDRIHGFIPGWKMPQIRESKFSSSQGFMADYLSEIMHRMRKRNYANVILNNVDFGDMSQRNQRSIVRIGSGLIKLIFPHRTERTIIPDELRQVLDVAVDLRGRVVEQLAVIAPSEFNNIRLSYKIKCKE